MLLAITSAIMKMKTPNSSSATQSDIPAIIPQPSISAKLISRPHTATRYGSNSCESSAASEPNAVRKTRLKCGHAVYVR